MSNTVQYLGEAGPYTKLAPREEALGKQNMLGHHPTAFDNDCVEVRRWESSCSANSGVVASVHRALDKMLV